MDLHSAGNRAITNAHATLSLMDSTKADGNKSETNNRHNFVINTKIYMQTCAL